MLAFGVLQLIESAAAYGGLAVLIEKLFGVGVLKRFPSTGTGAGAGTSTETGGSVEGIDS
jgi:hypothetical protein